MLWALLPVAAAVDIVIPSGCRADEALLPSDVAGVEDSDRSLSFTLESIKAYAPWAPQIFVLQNPECEEVWQRKVRRKEVPEVKKTIWMNRCRLFPGRKQEMQRLRSLDASFPELQLMHQGLRRSLKKGAGPECPTRNVFGVQTVLHRIPGLSERFVYVAPGDVALRPTSVKTFFYGMKPRYPLKASHQIYENRSISARLGALPRSAGGAPLGVWVPLTQRLLKRVAKRWPEWMSFVRSHRWGKYSSETDSFGTAASEERNSDEECLVGVWWWYLMWHPHSGVRHRGGLFQERLLGTEPGQWQQMRDTAPTAHLPRAAGRAPARRWLRHALKGFITLEISSRGGAEVVDEAQEPPEMTPEQQEGAALLNRFLRSER